MLIILSEYIIRVKGTNRIIVQAISHFSQRIFEDLIAPTTVRFALSSATLKGWIARRP
jgi:hypothetical protein